MPDLPIAACRPFNDGHDTRLRGRLGRKGSGVMWRVRPVQNCYNGTCASLHFSFSSLMSIKPSFPPTSPCCCSFSCDTAKNSVTEQLIVQPLKFLPSIEPNAGTVDTIPIPSPAHYARASSHAFALSTRRRLSGVTVFPAESTLRAPERLNSQCRPSKSMPWLKQASEILRKKTGTRLGAT